MGKGKAWKAAGVVALVAVAGWISISERTRNPELARWQGRDWTVECTDPGGRTWTLGSFRYLDGSTSPPRRRFTDRGVEVGPPGGAKPYKTTLFRHRALAKDRVWRWTTRPMGSGWSTEAYAGLPEGTAEVEVAERLDRVWWTDREGVRTEWPCRGGQRE